MIDERPSWAFMRRSTKDKELHRFVAAVEMNSRAELSAGRQLEEEPFSAIHSVGNVNK